LVVCAQAARSQGGRAIRRSNGCTGRERNQTTRAGACQSGQCACAPRDDPARLATSSASKGQRVGSVVSGAHCRRPQQNAQEHDCSASSTTSHCASAAADDGRSTGRSAHSTGGVMIIWGSTVEFCSSVSSLWQAAADGPRGGQPDL